MIIIVSLVLMNRHYQPGWFEDLAQDTTAFASFYYLGSTLVIITAVKMKTIPRWLKFIMLSAFFFLLTMLLQTAGLLVMNTWWDPWYYTLFPALVYRIAEGISRRLSRISHAAHNSSVT
ncbi:hypothetical protein J2T17_007440 [Paenibacillus mucilaginosus]|uniref:hypothetical protein n=1 Tax=Paenibacillus mucilaginosus TaxID=61624 RepID=UPI003D20D78F